MSAYNNSQSVWAGVGRRPCQRFLRGGMVAAIVLVFGLAPARAQSSGASLSDVVRENKPAHKAAHVFTNDEIPSVASPVADSSSATGNSSITDTKDNSASITTPSTAPSSKDAKNSKSGITVPGLLANGSLAQAQALLEGLKHDHQALIDNYDKIEKKLADTDDDSLRRVYSDSLSRRNEVMTRNEEAIADTESAIHAAQAADAQGDTHETQ